MIRDLIDMEKIRRVILYLVYIFAVQFFQDTFFLTIAIFGVKMFFVPAAVVAIGAFEGGVWGAALGLVAGFLCDVSYGNVALFTLLFPVLGFFAGVLTRWFVNASLFAYMIMCLAAFAVTAFFQLLGLFLAGNSLMPMVRTAIIQTIWSLPMAAALYFPCKAIGRRKV